MAPRAANWSRSLRCCWYRWRRWVCGGEEFPKQEPGHHWSPFLSAVGLAFWVARRMSPFEWFKHTIWNPLHEVPNRGVPAWFSDGYFIAGWALLCSFVVQLAFLPNPCSSTLVGWLACAWMLQIVQSSLFHLVWRAQLRPEASFEVHSHVRNLLLAWVSFVQITVLAGVAYYLLFRGQIVSGGTEPRGLQSVWEGIYFACVTGLTIGFGDFTPQSTGARLAVVAHALLSATMLGVVVARALAAIRAPRQSGPTSEDAGPQVPRDQ